MNFDCFASERKTRLVEFAFHDSWPDSHLSCVWNRGACPGRTATPASFEFAPTWIFIQESWVTRIDNAVRLSHRHLLWFEQLRHLQMVSTARCKVEPNPWLSPAYISRLILNADYILFIYTSCESAKVRGVGYALQRAVFASQALNDVNIFAPYRCRSRHVSIRRPGACCCHNDMCRG